MITAVLFIGGVGVIVALGALLTFALGPVAALLVFWLGGLAATLALAISFARNTTVASVTDETSLTWSDGG